MTFLAKKKKKRGGALPAFAPLPLLAEPHPCTAVPHLCCTACLACHPTHHAAPLRTFCSAALQTRHIFFFFLKEGHAYRRRRKAATQACKTSVRAPPPKRRAGKGAYDRAARSHASGTGRYGARSVEVRKQHTKNQRRECMAWKQRTHITRRQFDGQARWQQSHWARAIKPKSTTHLLTRDRTYPPRGVVGAIGNQGGEPLVVCLGRYGLACVSGTALLGLRMPLGNGCASRQGYSFVYVCRLWPSALSYRSVRLHHRRPMTLLPPHLAIGLSAGTVGALNPSHTFPALVLCVLLANLDTPCAVASCSASMRACCPVIGSLTGPPHRGRRPYRGFACLRCGLALSSVRMTYLQANKKRKKKSLCALANLGTPCAAAGVDCLLVSVLHCLLTKTAQGRNANMQNLGQGLPTGGGPRREPMTGQHAHMQAKLML